ncbi:MAG: pyridoxamine 5-phosphate oxidase [Bradyrhizobium sp.]|nr:pyridoxamine 5-phosphate oxidase [Bradyrhizobium sp.]
MPYGFLDIAMTPSVRAAQEANGSGGHYDNFKGKRSFDAFSEDEKRFIETRDSFFMASVSESGWPYVQHRGGPPGFLRVLDERTFGFADYRGNLQYISLGNISVDDRVALILMDYPHRARLKIFAHLKVHALDEDPALAARLIVPGYKAKVERLMVLTLEAFDWNCPQHITPRFTETEIAAAVAPLHQRLAELEAENARLVGKLAARS